MPTCGKIVRTIDNTKLPCKCAIDHEGGCNPFSPVPFMLASKEPQQTKASQTELYESYKLREGQIQCLWFGAHGRCVLRLGHFPDIPHKEDTGKHE